MLELKCPNCKAEIELDDSREIGFCRYCGTKVLIEPNKSKVDGIAGVDNLLLRAEQFYSENNFEKAKEYYNRVLDVDINNSSAKQGIINIEQKSYEIKKGDIVTVTVTDFTGKSYVGCIIARLQNGRELPIPVANISPTLLHTSINNGDIFSLICEDIKENRPILVGQEVKKLHDKERDIQEQEKNMSFIEQLNNRQKMVSTNAQSKIGFEYALANSIIEAIKRACKESFSEHRIEGIYGGFDGGNEGWNSRPFIIYKTEKEADKKKTPHLKIEDYNRTIYWDERLGNHGIIPGNTNIQLLTKLLEKDLSLLGLKKYYYKFIPVPDTVPVRGKLNGVKRSFSGKVLYELTGKSSYDVFIRMEW